MSSTWAGEAWLAGVERRLARNVQFAAEALSDRVREVVGVQGSRTDRSKPGEPPRRQTGNLQEHVTSYPVDTPNDSTVVSMVQTSALSLRGFDYAEHLELQMDRPHLRVTMEENGEMIRDTILGDLL